MRFKVDCQRGVALVDAVDEDDAEEYMEREYGRASGPYEAERCQDQSCTSLGFGGMKIHRTPAVMMTRENASDHVTR
jgi:hypothetical protein